MSADLPEKLALLLFGWLLGLLAPAIVDAIRRKRDNELGRLAIISELRELGCFLATASYGVRLHSGSIERAFLEWLKTDLEGHAVTPEFQKFIPNVRKLLESTDGELRAMSDALTKQSGGGITLQKYSAPLLDSRVAALHSFDTNVQRGLLSIRQELQLLDDLVDRSRKWIDLTFTKLEGENYRLVAENLRQCLELYAERTQRTTKLVRTVTGSWSGA